MDGQKGSYIDGERGRHDTVPFPNPWDVFLVGRVGRREQSVECVGNDPVGIDDEAERCGPVHHRRSVED